MYGLDSGEYVFWAYDWTVSSLSLRLCANWLEFGYMIVHELQQLDPFFILTLYNNV